MGIKRGLFVRQIGTAPDAIGTTPQEARLAIAGLLAENTPGSPRQGLLHQASATPVTGAATMTYTVSPINPVLVRSANDGVYLPTLTGVTTVGTLDAPASGSRIDLIWVKQNDGDRGDADNTAVLGVTQGDAAPIPIRPNISVPAGAYVLASKVVAAGETNTLIGAPVLQEWVHTVARGAVIPVKNAADQAAVAPGPGISVRRLDLPQTPTFTGDGTKWVGLGWVDIPVLDTNKWEPQQADKAQLSARSDRIQLRGKFKYKSATAATAGMTSSTAIQIGRIPEGYRPSATMAFIAIAIWGATNNHSPCRIEIQADGLILLFGIALQGVATPFSVTTNTYVYLSSISYSQA